MLGNGAGPRLPHQKAAGLIRLVFELPASDLLVVRRFARAAFTSLKFKKQKPPPQVEEKTCIGVKGDWVV